MGRLAPVTCLLASMESTNRATDTRSAVATGSSIRTGGTDLNSPASHLRIVVNETEDAAASARRDIPLATLSSAKVTRSD